MCVYVCVCMHACVCVCMCCVSVCVCLCVSLLPLVCHHYRLSYDVDMQVSVGTGPDKKSSYNKVDLKNPYFRFSSTAPAPPPGSIHDNPTDQYWSGDDSTANKVTMVLL